MRRRPEFDRSTPPPGRTLPAERSAGPGWPRRGLLGALAVVGASAACSSEDTGDTARSADPGSGRDDSTETNSVGDGSGDSSIGWSMPAEEANHERTWMCWPWREDVWGDDLAAVQDAVERIALAISDFEPVTMLCRPSEIATLRERLGDDVELLGGPVDDLWARDTLPCFLTGTDTDGQELLAAGRFEFNGWGGKQVHDGDAQLAHHVADHLGIALIDSGIVGEGGGLEVDGHGTVLAARSSWVNDNRNPHISESNVASAILDTLGAEQILWIDGLAGADITDGHIDTLARFAAPTTIVVDAPAFDDADDPWVEVAVATRSTVSSARTLDGRAFEIVEVVQPSSPRGEGADFLSTYMNFYVCNGAVIAPEFGDDEADEAARSVLEALYPHREVVMVDIDALAAGGGGIHCATQQQPAVAGHG